MSSLLDLVEMVREREVWSKYQGQISTTLNRYGSYTTFIDGSKSEDRLCISEQKADCGWQSSPVNFDLHCRVVCHLNRRNQADYFVKQPIEMYWDLCTESCQRPTSGAQRSDRSSSMAFRDVSMQVDHSGLGVCLFCWLLECKSWSQGQSGSC